MAQANENRGIDWTQPTLAGGLAMAKITNDAIDRILNSLPRVATPRATGVLENYTVEIDDCYLGAIAIVDLAYEISHPEHYGNGNPHFDCEITWRVEAIRTMSIVGPKASDRPVVVLDHGANGQAAREAIESRPWLQSAIELAIRDEAARVACGRHFGERG